MEVKRAIAGYGGADKKQVQEMVRLLLDLEDVPQPDDAADALAVAICHIHAAHMAARSPPPSRGGCVEAAIPGGGTPYDRQPDRSRAGNRQDWLVILVGGVGFRVAVPQTLLEGLVQQPGELSLHTHLHVGRTSSPSTALRRRTRSSFSAC